MFSIIRNYVPLYYIEGLRQSLLDLEIRIYEMIKQGNVTNFTSFKSNITHKPLISKFETPLRLHSHSLQPNPPTDTCSQLHKLLICLYVYNTVAT
jgi:hypothetical protein